jgi:hypothetical protein
MSAVSGSRAICVTLRLPPSSSIALNSRKRRRQAACSCQFVVEAACERSCEMPEQPPFLDPARLDPPVNFHGLRHTYASGLRRRVPLAVIAAQLGHAGTRMGREALRPLVRRLSRRNGSRSVRYSRNCRAAKCEADPPNAVGPPLRPLQRARERTFAYTFFVSTRPRHFPGHECGIDYRRRLLITVRDRLWSRRPTV